MYVLSLRRRTSSLFLFIYYLEERMVGVVSGRFVWIKLVLLQMTVEQVCWNLSQSWRHRVARTWSSGKYCDLTVLRVRLWETRWQATWLCHTCIRSTWTSESIICSSKAYESFFRIMYDPEEAFRITKSLEVQRMRIIRNKKQSSPCIHGPWICALWVYSNPESYKSF